MVLHFICTAKLRVSFSGSVLVGVCVAQTKPKTLASTRVCGWVGVHVAHAEGRRANDHRLAASSSAEMPAAFHTRSHVAGKSRPTNAALPRSVLDDAIACYHNNNDDTAKPFNSGG